MRFATPLAFLLLLALPLCFWWERRRLRQAALAFSTVAQLAAAGRSPRLRFARLPLVLRALALVFLTVALARPQAGVEKMVETSRGVAIEMVVDRSGSMGQEMAFRGRAMSRLDVVKEVFLEFVRGNARDLGGRTSDLIGMVAFARHPETVAPLTLSHGVLAPFLKSVQVARERAEDGTAIGDALALACARLKTAEETLARATGAGKAAYAIKSKVIILLTDGENNMGERLPADAAKLAAEWGIRIYAIGVGGDEVMNLPSFFGMRALRGGGVDKKTLQAVADATGGRFWLAEDGEALATVYQEIDRLEKSEVESLRYVDYKERFLPWALAALALLVSELVLAATIFRRAP